MSKPRETNEARAADSQKHDESLNRLFRAALNGDRRAAVEFWEEIRLLVRKLACVICRKYGTQDSDIDDIIQNAILRCIHLPSEKLLEIRSWHAFLFPVVHQCAINHHHRRERVEKHETSADRTAADGEESAENMYEIVRGFHDVLSDVRARELADAVDRILASLPKEKVEVFCLYCQGHKYREIASMLKIPENTVATFISRTKQQISQRLDSGE